MNNKKMKIAVIALAIALAVLLPVTVLVVSAATTGDPLILFTKDYFDSKVLPELNEKNSEQDQNIDSLNTKYTTLLAQYAALADKVAAITGQGEVTVSQSGFLEVKLEKDQTLVPAGTNAQCLEVILKRGNAQVVSPYNTAGLVDVTDGVELTDGSALVTNHYILIPHSNDGRCILAVEGDVWVLVRGEYTIES